MESVNIYLINTHTKQHDTALRQVLHGMDFDIQWLQKDFGLYVVNAFDTSQAARVLSLPHFSLAYLLKVGW